MIAAELRPEDNTRGGRVILAWIRGDREALDLALAEADAAPGGTAGLLFAVTDFAARLAVLAPGAEAKLEELILQFLDRME